MSPLRIFGAISLLCFAIAGGCAFVWPPVLWSFVVLIPLFLLGLYDANQKEHAILRNFPVVGHARYLLEMIRPEIQQYFIESHTSGRPFSRELRDVVYQRAKNVTDTRPFGTIRILHEIGSEWIAHSINAKHPPEKTPRIHIGGDTCQKPYSASLLNISAMSFGALSANAIRALNGGAKMGSFAHNTGEGGISSYHLELGGDLIWQVGTGYFGCRTRDGRFDPAAFEETAKGVDSVRMIEIKISQGAKPGHGGILPAAKVTPEIARIRGVPLGQDVISPPSHRAFSTPMELLDFISVLRERSGGKPVGIKLCVGQRSEFLGICKAMVESNIAPDFITIDGAEGGTAAAPLEFSNSIGMPLTDGLLFVHNALVGCGLRKRIRLIGSGKIVTGFTMVRFMALGADLCASARGMMFSMGCIQALKCNTNHCPVGVATQDPDLSRGLDVADKKVRVFNFHHNTLKSFMAILGSAGIVHPEELQPSHIEQRVSCSEVKNFGQMYEYLEEGALLSAAPPASMAAAWREADAHRF